MSGHKQVLVRRVLDDLPAAQGGVRAEDQIVKIGNRRIEGIKDARAALSEVHAGDTVIFLLRRGSGNSSHELTLKLTAAEGL